MAHEAKNLSETFTFKILHMLNISTCILLGTEKQKEARPCGSCTGTTACISQNKGWRKLWSDSQRLSDWAYEEKRRCHLTPLYLTPALEETGQGISLLLGLVLRMVAAAAAGIQTVKDEPMRLQNAMAQGQCGPAGVPLDLGSFPPLTYAGKRGLVHVFGEQLPLRCRATSHRRERRHQWLKLS